MTTKLTLTLTACVAASVGAVVAAGLYTEAWRVPDQP